MIVTYICHSGFLVETPTIYYLFDYYKGTIPKLLPDKPVVVLVSHSHPDHYNFNVYEKLIESGATRIYAVLSKDIFKSSIPANVEYIMVKPNQTYSLWQGQELTTFKSTDLGVAFFLESQEGNMYHGGDLNDWVWAEESDAYNQEMTKNYRKEINKLAEITKETGIDAAFVPLDPRQEKDYARGMLYFLEKVHPKKVYPMHYWDKPEIIEQFTNEYGINLRKEFKNEI